MGKKRETKLKVRDRAAGQDNRYGRRDKTSVDVPHGTCSCDGLLPNYEVLWVCLASGRGEFLYFCSDCDDGMVDKSPASEEEISPLLEELGVSASFVGELQELCERLYQDTAWKHRVDEIARSLTFRPTRTIRFEAVETERDPDSGWTRQRYERAEVETEKLESELRPGRKTVAAEEKSGRSARSADASGPSKRPQCCAGLFPYYTIGWISLVTRNAQFEYFCPTCGRETIVKSSACDEEVAPLFEELGVSKSFVRALQALCDRLREEPQWSHKPQEITEAFKFKPTRNLYRAVRIERDSKEIAARSYELVRGDLANA